MAEIRKVLLCRGGLRQSLMLFDNNLKGTMYGFTGANSFAISAPIAFCCFDNSYFIMHQHEGTAATYADA